MSRGLLGSDACAVVRSSEKASGPWRCLDLCSAKAEVWYLGSIVQTIASGVDGRRGEQKIVCSNHTAEPPRLF